MVTLAAGEAFYILDVLLGFFTSGFRLPEVIGHLSLTTNSSKSVVIVERVDEGFPQSAKEKVG